MTEEIVLTSTSRGTMSSSKKFNRGRKKTVTRELNSNTHIAATKIFKKRTNKSTRGMGQQRRMVISTK
jgi:hypothetical protein